MPLQIEAMVVETGLQFTTDLRVQHAILETDSLVLVKALREDIWIELSKFSIESSKAIKILLTLIVCVFL